MSKHSLFKIETVDESGSSHHMKSHDYRAIIDAKVCDHEELKIAKADFLEAMKNVLDYDRETLRDIADDYILAERHLAVCNRRVLGDMEEYNRRAPIDMESTDRGTFVLVSDSKALNINRVDGEDCAVDTLGDADKTIDKQSFWSQYPVALKPMTVCGLSYMLFALSVSVTHPEAQVLCNGLALVASLLCIVYGLGLEGSIPRWLSRESAETQKEGSAIVSEPKALEDYTEDSQPQPVTILTFDDVRDAYKYAKQHASTDESLANLASVKDGSNIFFILQSLSEVHELHQKDALDRLEFLGTLHSKPGTKEGTMAIRAGVISSLVKLSEESKLLKQQEQDINQAFRDDVYSIEASRFF